MNYNKAIVLGRVTQAPEPRKTPGGQSVTSFSVATNRVWTDKNGQKQENVEFHHIVAWGKLADVAGSYLVKGSLVLVEGRFETRSWQDKEGNTRKATQIVAEGMQLGPKPGAPVGKVEEPPAEDPMPVINLDGDEEDTGRDMEPIPF